MSRATQTLHTCDRCGQSATSPLGTRKKPEGWREAEAVVPSEGSSDGAGVAAVDLCPECVASAVEWWRQVGARP